ncbi:MAG: DUF6498-containing protein [Xanthomonadaceae bacterium]|jgi:hypothetical protein|nr:DUF6498-containing protein [Xanthomonadaceae bacterium]
MDDTEHGAPSSRRPEDGRLALAALLAGNAATLAIAIAQGWSMAALLLPYWLQSVAIGAFNVRRILALRRFSTKGLSSGGQRVPETREGQVSTARFFAFHYGGFHLGYLLFVLATPPAVGEWPWLAACAAALLVAQWREHRADVRDDAAGRPNLGLLMFAPYVRVVPMHLTAIFAIGAEGAAAMLWFGLLKTLADVGAWAIDRALFARARAGVEADAG